MKYLFFVQGEGRGHMTQALALKEKLEASGHIISAVILGSKAKEKIPLFFSSLINVPLFTIDSPRFLTDKKNKGIRVISSIINTLWHTPLYLRSIKKIRRIVLDCQPDVLVNFYEPLAGNYYRLYIDKRPMFCIGHQHFIEHAVFKFPEINLMAKIAFKFYNRMTAPSRSTRIALSFTDEADCPKKKLFICPPLIRQIIKKQTAVDNKSILVYLLNTGYCEEIIDWCGKNRAQKIDAFWDREEAETYFGDNLVFHYLDGKKFIDCLANCTAYACTAGFDSIAEAAYLQKNILMIPTKNHFEQKCNAADAVRAGVAIQSDNFDISLLINSRQKTHSAKTLKDFKEWVDNYNDKIVSLMERRPIK